MNPTKGLKFPSLPTGLAEKHSFEKIRLRPFGIDREDLALDFSETNIPLLVSEVLKQCTTGQNGTLSGDFFRDLSVGKRLECLLFLVGEDEESGFSFLFKCDACGQGELEFELSLEAISEIQKEADPFGEVEVEIGGEKFIFRKPLGRDQETWQKNVFEDEQTAAFELIRSLQISPKEFVKFDEETFKQIEKALDEADPLVDFVCQVRCLECDSVNEIEIDLFSFAMGELYKLQRRLLKTVHRLATHYHWTEKEIFAVPHKRRSQYLKIIADEEKK